MSTIRQYSFSSGEIAPALQTRVDVSKYHSALKTCRNMMVMRYGGATSRPGTVMVTAGKTPSKALRLIPFVQSASVSYMLEFGDFYMRVISNGVQLTVSGVAAWSNATTYAQGDLVSSGGVNYWSKFSGNLNHAPPNATFWYPLTGSIFEVPTPYAVADLAALKFVQSINKLIFAHSSYAPQVLTRISTQTWQFAPIPFGSSMIMPNNCATAAAVAGAATFNYQISCLNSAGDESAARTVFYSGAAATLSVTNYITLTIDTFFAPIWPGTTSYNVYRQSSTGSSDYGYIGSFSVGAGFFKDIGADADLTNRPPDGQDMFNTSGNYPAVVSLSQQRLVFASTTNYPETVWASRTGAYYNFWTQSIVTDNSPVTFTLSGRQLNTVTNIVELGNLFLFTPTSELNVSGDVNGILKPSSINLKTQGLNGSSSLTPLIVDGNLVFVQARGSVVRDMFFQLQVDSYRGNELSVFAPHLIEGFTFVDWAYQQIPHSIIWMVRNDGLLIGLTYVKEQEIVAWHRHDFSGTTYDASVENVCVISEGGYDAVYLVVRRYVNGVLGAFIERMATRFIADAARITSSSTVLPFPNDPSVDVISVDCSLAYDGRGKPAMTLSGGTTWDYTETLTLTAATATFQNSYVGLKYFLNLTTTGTPLIFTVTGYTSTTVVTGTVDRTVPVNMRNVSIPGTSLAVHTVSGLSHLEGERVSVLADGYVVGSPNNADYPTYTVTGGSITLDGYYAVIRVGLPLTCDLESLTIDTAQGESIVDKQKISTEITINMEKTKGVWVGEALPTGTDPLQNLSEMKIRQYEGYDSSVSLSTGPNEITITPSWNSKGSVFIRQVDPLPMTILSVAVDGLYPFKGGG